MKVLIVVVAIAVLILSFGTIYVGARLRENTVAAHPYEAGQDYVKHAAEAAAGDPHAHRSTGNGQSPCDLGQGACQAELRPGDALQIEVQPRPVTAMKEISLTASLSRGGAKVQGAGLSVSFTMEGMPMGDNSVALKETSPGVYEGKAILVKCMSGRRDWRAEVTVRDSKEDLRARFPLGLGE